jgi:hypothetical protein
VLTIFNTRRKSASCSANEREVSPTVPAIIASELDASPEMRFVVETLMNVRSSQLRIVG